MWGIALKAICLVKFSEETFLKPGFNQMYKTFAKFIENKDIDFCCMDDAKKTMQICLDLIGK